MVIYFNIDHNKIIILISIDYKIISFDLALFFSNAYIID
jgi:hypothetical protein